VSWTGAAGELSKEERGWQQKPVQRKKKKKKEGGLWQQLLDRRGDRCWIQKMKSGGDEDVMLFFPHLL
jgi:hypothetical protein